MSGFVAQVCGGLSVIATFAVVEWLARSSTPERVFQIALGRARTRADDARVRRVRVVNLACAVAALVGVLAPLPPGLALGLTLGATSLAVGWLLVEMGLLVRTIELEDLPTRFAVSLEEPPSARDYVSMPLQVANVLAVVLPTIVFAWVVRSLPSAVPLHWDLAGHVDRVGPPAAAWSLGAVMLFDLLLLWGIVYAVAKERWALPPGDASRYVALSTERRTLIVRLVEWVILLANAGIGVGWGGTALGVAMGGDALPGLAAVAAVSAVLASAACLLPLVVYVPKLRKVSDALRAEAGTEVLGTRRAGWRWGGIVYFAPDDPALFVPKRVGIGVTLNMARPLAWVVLGGAILIPLVISAIAAR